VVIACHSMERGRKAAGGYIGGRWRFVSTKLTGLAV